MDSQETKHHTLGEGTQVLILPHLAHKFIPL